ncbi:MAG: R3H domain-containing nucleic acid-binding protein [Candidatus Yanofskybacteria bacterium]|nr:R3H domain-containing nucleic acid-binding protein [Candidatus Yanofskybacteria bacterium]
MISKDHIQIIQGETEALFQKLGIETEVLVEDQGDEGILVSARMEEPQLFIGEKGQTLAEIQHLIRAILRKKIGEPVFLRLDINNYRKNREQYLRELATTTADEVSLLKHDRELPPMPASERRVIHAMLTGRQDVVSESIGEEPNRRIVIKIKGESGPNVFGDQGSKAPD